MKIKKSLVAALISASICAPAVASEDHGRFYKKLYIGAAGGMTKLSPEIRGSVGDGRRDKEVHSNVHLRQM